MTRRGLALFALMSVVWGIPYLFIKVAVHHLSPSMVVEGRTLIGAVVLLPLAVRQGQLRPLLKVWKPLLAYCVAELAIPWFFLSVAERRLPSSLSGLLVATVPLVTVLLAALSGHRDRIGGRGLVGLLVGLVGVGLLLGLSVSGHDWGSVAEVGITVVGYSTGPLLTARYFSKQSSLALAAVSLAVVAIGYLPAAIIQRPAQVPPGTTIASIVVLGLVCTALAFVAFFELIKEVEATRATVITYFNPAVALVLGVVFLGEAFKVSTAGGFALILLGSWVSTRSRRELAGPAEPTLEPVTGSGS